MTLAIYFVGLADNLQTVCMLTAVFSAFAAGAMGVVWSMFRSNMPNEHEMVVIEKLAKLIRPAMWVTLVAVIAATLTPSSRTLAAMIVVPRLTESEQVQNIADNTLRALEKLTAEWAEETVLGEGKVGDD